MIELEQPTLFDYASLDGDTRAFVQEKTQAIHARLKRTAEDIIAIGQDLIEVKARLQYGQFMPWVQSEFDMSYDSANDFMNVAKRLGGRIGKFPILPSVSVIRALSSPSTPDVIIEQVESGVIPPSLSAIREAKQEYQQAQETPVFSPTWNHVDGVPFTAPLPDCYPANRISPLQT